MIIWYKNTQVVLRGSTESFKDGAPIHGYCASKHAALGFARAAALQLGPLGVRINTICPGTIWTPLYDPESQGPAAVAMDKELRARTPLRRMGGPDEVAKVAKFLLNEDASYIAGTTIVVDGGLTTKSVQVNICTVKASWAYGQE